jgi:DUF4097 and DUF4098 domain-containing protein YvlB
MTKLITRGVFFAIVAAMSCVAALAQEKSLACGDNWHNDKLVNSCEIREQTLPATETLSVDGRANGGISIKGSERRDVLVRARVQGVAATDAEAKQLASEVRIETAGGTVFVSGPENRDGRWWSVSYEIFVPLRSNLSLKTRNGGISIADVNGRVEFSALNGGVNLKRVGGYVHGSTTNGGLNIELAGDRWDGETLDVNTTNGGVNMSVPENYSARLETGTVNGRIHVDFPLTVQGDITRELAVNLGSGGATIKAKTVNGGVRIHHKGDDGSKLN